MFLKATHFATFAHTLGGLQSVVKHHLAHDFAWQIDSTVQTFFETSDAPITNRERALGLSWRETITEARKRLAAQHRPQPDQTIVYHDLWGLPFFADLDGADRRIGVIHCPDGQVLGNLTANHDLLDGVLCVGQPAVEAAHRCWPGAGLERIVFVPVPVNMPESPAQHPPLAGRSLVIGYSGRLIKSNKRADRLPIFYRHLKQLDLNFQLELLGEGPEEFRLRRRFRDCPEVRFHGRRDGGDYWRILNRWDVIVCLSEVEGMGISMLEAMSVGVFPLHPKIGGGAEAFVKSLDADFLYLSGDLSAAARGARAISSMQDATAQTLRARCREIVLPHQGGNYMKIFSEFLGRIQALPRVSRAVFKPRPFYLSDYIPFGVLNRISPHIFTSNHPA